MHISQPKPILIRQIVRAALYEDLGTRGDVTSSATIPKNLHSIARVVACESGVVCGIDVAREVFRQYDRKIRTIPLCRDGMKIRQTQNILEIRGKTRAILAAERTALNFIQHLSGIATLTHRFVENSKQKVLDTRKTTPLLRALEKYAVCCGGGTNHRFGLYDMVLIKDNHLVALAQQYPHPIIEAVSRSRKRWPGLKVEVECDTLIQVQEAIEARADIILLDNMTLLQLRRAVQMVRGRAKTEASGGITLKTVSAIARTGVDFISVGALTHSASSLSFSLELS